MKNSIGLNALVTGGAGFIGSNLVDRLLDRGYRVVCVDNFILGKKENIQSAFRHEDFSIYNFDLLEKERLNELVKKKHIDIVFHLAANSDIREGTKNTDRDLKLNFLTTYNVLECMKENNVKKIVFTSTPAVYGYHNDPLKEEFTMKPESLYGASKLAAEAFIQAFAKLYGIQSWIFRLSNMVGERMTHGILYDFLNKIKKNPKELKVLGDGNQCKPYMYVHDLIDAFFFVIENAKDLINIFNIGPKDSTKVSEIVEIFLEELKLDPKIVYSGGKTGWKGDVARYSHDASKLGRLGWKPKMGSTEAVRFAIKRIIESAK